MEPRFLGPEANLEIAFEVARAVEGEAQKINSLRASSSSLSRVNMGKATEFDEFGLFRRQSKPELAQPLAEGILNTNGIGTVLEAQYKIINIAHHVGFALETGLYRTLKPEIEHIVQVNIAQ